MSAPPAALAAAYAYCADLVRQQDRDRFLASLFAPEASRPHLHALYAYNVELARVREMVRDPLPGEVRLAWWREVLEGAGRGEVAGHPVAAALMDTVARHALPVAPLVALADARIFELYDDPMPSLGDLEGYAGETASALIQLGRLILAPETAPRAADASGHGGVAQALTGLMRLFPVQAARGQCFLPLDLLARHGLDREAAICGTPTPGLAAVLADLRAEALRHLKLSAAAFAVLPPDGGAGAASALPLALVSADLKALARVRDPFRQQAGLPRWRRALRLWQAARAAARGPDWLSRFT